jgi:exopolysaccharide biosynthesis protein
MIGVHAGRFRILVLNTQGQAECKGRIVKICGNRGRPVFFVQLLCDRERTERFRIDRGSNRPEWPVNCAYAIIEIKDPSQIRTASADEANPFRSSATKVARAIAKLKNAVFAVNGDYCAAFSGSKSTNYILRQGTVYSESVEPSLDMLLIDEDGDFHILTADEDLAAIDKTMIDGKRVINAFQFGPALVIDGEPVPDEIIMNPDRSPTYAKPGAGEIRLCIAQIDKLKYLVATCYGWGQELNNFRDMVMTLAPIKTAYTLDGGLSASLVFMNNKFNNVQGGSERAITDIIYFASAWDLYGESK